MNSNSLDPLRHDLDQLSKAGASVVALAQVLGFLEASADVAGSEVGWNTADLRGGLLLAIEQVGGRIDSVGGAMAARLESDQRPMYSRSA
jgi:hypothetical protein